MQREVELPWTLSSLNIIKYVSLIGSYLSCVFAISLFVIISFLVHRRQLLCLLLTALRVYGIWMGSPFKLTNCQHKYLEALLAYLRLVPKSNRRLAKEFVGENLNYSPIYVTIVLWLSYPVKSVLYKWRVCIVKFREHFRGA